MKSAIQSFPAPVGGLVESLPAAGNLQIGCEVCENFLPTARGLKVRKGTARASYVGAAVKRLMAYEHPSSPAFFAATETAVYDISSLDPVNAPSAEITGLSNGNWSSKQVGVSGGEYLVCVNGEDDARLFDGSTWAPLNASSTPSVTGVDTSTLSHVWTYRSRLFFVQKDSLKAWYLPSASIGGEANDINLGGIFQKGGSLLFGATWSIDAGDGADDKCVFVSTLGEAAIYSGEDPSNAANWTLEGRYDIGVPMSSLGFVQAGGDLLIATKVGIIPLSQAIQKDPAALSLAAVTRDVERTWLNEISAVSGMQLHKWSGGNLLLTAWQNSDQMLTANLQTGKWARQRGWEGDCAGIYGDSAFVGRENGWVYQIDTGGLDDGQAFTAKLAYSFSDMGNPTQYKVATMARAAFFADTGFDYRVSVCFDYSVKFPAAPNAVEIDGIIWGGGTLWGEGIWNAPQNADPKAGRVEHWRSISGGGYAMSPTVQITSGSPLPLSVELIRIDVMTQIGGVAC